jgi:hypothetical protein
MWPQEKFRMLRDGALSCRCESTAALTHLARESIGYLLKVLTLSSIALIAADGRGVLSAEGPKANIVGLGATTCLAFNRDVQQNFRIQRDYFAWAQGFMSGILVRAPPGKDEGLELIPPWFSLQKQVEFLRDFCAKNPNKDYSDGVAELYRALRGEQKS